MADPIDIVMVEAGPVGLLTAVEVARASLCWSVWATSGRGRAERKGS